MGSPANPTATQVKQLQNAGCGLFRSKKSKKMEMNETATVKIMFAPSSRGITGTQKVNKVLVMKKYFFILFGVLMLQISVQPDEQTLSIRTKKRSPILLRVSGLFLTSTPTGDAKIYQTHNQWTADGQWLIFRSGGQKAYLP